MTSPYMSLPIPDVGDPGTGYATDLNTCLEDIDSHNHSPGQGALIPTAGLNINSDLEFNDNSAIELKSTRYTLQDSVLVGALDKNCVYFVGGNLYINNNSGTSVQLTNGAAINLSTVGTIGGDYGQPGVNASAVYSDVTKVFSWTQEPTQAAKMAMGDILLYSTVAATNPITIKQSGTVATSYDFLIPEVAPTPNQIWRQDALGTGSDFVTVQGTANQLTITHAASTITASLPSTIIAPGSITTTTTLSSTGNFDVNTSKFTVAASSGDAYTAGTLTVTEAVTASSTVNSVGNFSVNTNKFTVAASSGDAYSAGTLSVAGTATFSGAVNITGNGQGIVPLGAIIAMTSGITGAMAIPASGVASNGWQRCDGAAIAGSQTLSGTTPNLSGSIFLMGSTTYGTTGGNNNTTLTNVQLPAHTHGATGLAVTGTNSPGSITALSLGTESANHTHTDSGHTHGITQTRATNVLSLIHI